jgi:hypothetical protein
MGWRCVTSHIKFHAMRSSRAAYGTWLWFVSGGPSAETKCCSFTTDRRMRTGGERERERHHGEKHTGRSWRGWASRSQGQHKRESLGIIGYRAVVGIRYRRCTHRYSTLYRRDAWHGWGQW